MKKKLRIGIVVPSGVMGGAEQLLLMLAQSYSAQENEVDLFFFTNESIATWTDSVKAKAFYTTHAKKQGSGIIKLSWLLLRKGLYKKEYDIFFTSHAYITAYVGFLRKLGILKIKRHVGRESTTIFTRFSGIALFKYRLYYKIGYSNVDLLICQTEFMKQQFIEGEKRLGEKLNIQVIHNPIDLKIIREKQQEKIMLPDVLNGKKYIVSAGRLIHEKGFDILIDSYKDLLEKYPELYLVILGEGNKRSELEAQVKKFHLENKVLLLGWTNNVLPYFKSAELCVVSSRIEGFPNVLLQMMAVNDKVASTLCAGGIDMIEGISTCNPNDQKGLLNAMDQALSVSSFKNRQLFDKYLEEHSIEKYIDTIEKFLN